MQKYHPYNTFSLASLAVLFSFVSPAYCNLNLTDFDVQISLHYLPSKVIGALGFAVYSLISSLLLWRLVRNRDWWALCLPIGAYCEAIGFLLRVFISQPKLRISLDYYIAMNSFVVLSPAAFLAFNYIMYGRLLRLCIGREHSFIKPERVGRTFVLSDIFTFIVQGAGGTIAVQARTANAGRNIFLTGIIAQAVSYVVYDFLVARSHRRAHREAERTGGPHTELWWKVFNLIYFSSVFIILKSIYRVAETVQGLRGYLITHEWCFLVFDSVPLAFATAVYVFFWPGNYMVAKVTSNGPGLQLDPISSTSHFELNTMASTPGGQPQNRSFDRLCRR